MSVSSQINRLKTNFSNSLDSVSAKGVAVPLTATSDDLSALIDSIPTETTLYITLTSYVDEDDNITYESDYNAKDIYEALEAGKRCVVRLYDDTFGTWYYYHINSRTYRDGGGVDEYYATTLAECYSDESTFGSVFFEFSYSDGNASVDAYEGYCDVNELIDTKIGEIANGTY